MFERTMKELSYYVGPTFREPPRTDHSVAYPAGWTVSMPLDCRLRRTESEVGNIYLFYFADGNRHDVKVDGAQGSHNQCWAFAPIMQAADEVRHVPGKCPQSPLNVSGRTGAKSPFQNELAAKEY